MNKLVTMSEFRARAWEFVREVEESRETIVVTRRGRPVVELRAVSAPEDTDTLHGLRGSVLFYERPFDPVGEDDWAEG
jgi:prevent-host-death family protein